MPKIPSLPVLTSPAEADLLPVEDTSATTTKSVSLDVLKTWLGIGSGWLPMAEAWTYVSATQFTIPGDFTGKMAVGTKIRLTQTTVKYFYVTSLSFGSGVTTVNIFAGTDYTLANAAITAQSYSNAESPAGFPGDFIYAPTLYKPDNSTALTKTVQNARFTMKGREVICQWNLLAIADPGTTNFIYVTLPVNPRQDATFANDCGFVSVDDTGGRFYIDASDTAPNRGAFQLLTGNCSTGGALKVNGKTSYEAV